MKLFFDTEFTGLHKDTTLISLGIVLNDKYNSNFYAEFTDYDQSQIDDWLEENVIANLKFNDRKPFHSESFGAYESKWQIKGTKEKVKEYLDEFLNEKCSGETIEVWSDCLSYDWVLFNDLYGHAFNIPDNMYYIPFDICTLMLIKGIDPDISREKFAGMEENAIKHNALWDAKVIKNCYNKLIWQCDTLDD